MRATLHGLHGLPRPFLPVLLLIVAVVAALPLVTGNPSLREELFFMLLLVTLATSVNVITGYTGYVSFGHIVFFGLGGYGAFWSMQVLGVHFLVAAALGVIPAVLVAVIVGGAVLRLRGAYFALATLGILEATKAFMTNFEPAGGAVGLSFNFSVYANYGGAKSAAEMAYVFMALVALGAITASYLVRHSKFGLALMTIREDQDAAVILGIDPARTKVAAFVISAVFPALAGAAFFFKNGIIEPSSAFDLTRSIESLVIVVLGGIGTVAGPVIGAAAYEWLRGFLITNPALASFQLTIAGVLLLVVVLFATSGLVGVIRSRVPRARGWLE